MITININQKFFRLVLIAVIALLAVNISPGSAEKLTIQSLTPMLGTSLADMGTAFTYQGRLLDGSDPANGTYDFDFNLYDVSSGGTALTGSLVSTGDDVTVTNGLFMVEIDFGPLAGAAGLRDSFNGLERYLEIGVRDGASSGSFTVLSPRQKFNPTPYATFARTIYRRTVVVKPLTPTGSESDNGKVLLNELNDIDDAAADNRYLLKIEPGIYDLENDHLALKPYVDVEGSGEGVTIIKGYGMITGSTGELWGTVTGADGVEIRDLTIESRGYIDEGEWYTYAIGVYNPAGVTLKMTHVTVNAYDGQGFTTGIMNDGDYVEPDFIPAFLYLDDVTADAEFTQTREAGIVYRTTGILNDDTSMLTMTDSYISAINGVDAYGIDNARGAAYIYDSEIFTKGDFINEYIGISNRWEESSLFMRDSRVNVGVFSSYGPGSRVNGIMNSDAGNVELFDSNVSVYGESSLTIGINAGGIAPRWVLALTNVKVLAIGNNVNYGIYSSDVPVAIRDSHIRATGGMKAVGMLFWDEGTPDVEVTQTIIEADNADPDSKHGSIEQ